MKKHFLIDCSAVIDTIYGVEQDSFLSLLFHPRIGLHLMLCPRCAGEIKKLRHLERIMKTDFLPSSPGFEDILMERLDEEDFIREEIDAPAGFSFKGWVMIGFFLLLSLSSSFFGMNFVEIADMGGLSFLLPIGLTIGMAVTCYGALFIGSHLKELSSRFGLR